MQCAWLLQADALQLECVDNVMNFDDTQQLLDSYAEAAHMHIDEIVFDFKINGLPGGTDFGASYFAMTSRPFPCVHGPLFSTAAPWGMSCPLMPFGRMSMNAN